MVVTEYEMYGTSRCLFLDCRGIGPVYQRKGGDWTTQTGVMCPSHGRVPMSLMHYMTYATFSLVTH